MNIPFTDTEIAALRSCYFRFVKRHENTTTVEEEDIAADPFSLFPANQSSPDEQYIVSLTPALWRTLREAILKEIPVWEAINAHIITAHRHSLLLKLDTFALTAHVEEALESENAS